jgi:transposase-like protein
LIFGHRRHRACQDLKLPVLAAIWTEPLSDAALFAFMERENRELKRANDILRTASAFFAQAELDRRSK